MNKTPTKETCIYGKETCIYEKETYYRNKYLAWKEY